MIEPAMPALGKLVWDTLAPLQDALGAHHDAHLRVEQVERFGLGARAEDEPAVVQLLARALSEKDRATKELERVVTRWESSRRLRKLRRALH